MTAEPYTWALGDDPWLVCRDRARAHGYPDVPTMILDLRKLNPTIADWGNVPVNTVVLIPHRSAS